MAAPLLEGYGQTESTGASFITYAEDPEVGHVGGPVVIYL
jgi:long-chain acyl-CoA synthetase